MIRFAVMKKAVGIILIIFLITVAPALTVFAAPPPPPPNPGTGDVPIGGMPIGGGLIILVALAVGYGVQKLYNARKRKINE